MTDPTQADTVEVPIMIRAPKPCGDYEPDGTDACICGHSKYSHDLSKSAYVARVRAQARASLRPRLLQETEMNTSEQMPNEYNQGLATRPALTLDTANRFGVSASAGKYPRIFKTMMFGHDGITPEDALVVAAWLVTLAEPISRHTFEEILAKVRES